MSILSARKVKNVYQRFALYLVEILIIFIGITISFLFEQWREEQRQKEDLIGLAESLLRDAKIEKAHLASDLGGTNTWILTLDSLRIQRDSKKVKDLNLIWFHNLLTGKTFGLFNSKSPAYLSAISNGSLSKLPDSIQVKIYDVYENSLPDFQYLYEQQLETVRYFRNESISKSTSYAYNLHSADVQVDLSKFTQDLQQPMYGNLINQIITVEQQVRIRNIKLTEKFDAIIRKLESYILIMRTQ